MQRLTLLGLIRWFDGFYVNSVERQVEVGLVVLLAHRGYIKVRALRYDWLELYLQRFEYL